MGNPRIGGSRNQKKVSEVSNNDLHEMFKTASGKNKRKIAMELDKRFKAVTQGK